jgi:DnaJ-class molecular chaperone
MSQYGSTSLNPGFIGIIRNYTATTYLETNVIIPESLSKEQKELLEKFKSLEDSNNNSEIKNFVNKAKKFWENIR